jgi:hypothetical protein
MGFFLFKCLSVLNCWIEFEPSWFCLQIYDILNLWATNLALEPLFYVIVQGKGGELD